MTPRTPHSFLGHRIRGLIAPEFSAGANALGLDQPRSFDRALSSAKTVKGGRSDNFLLSHPQWPGRVRIRPLRHGGMLGGSSGDHRYFSARRCEHEFDLWRNLEAKGAPLPRVAFAISRRRGPFWIPNLGTLNLEGAKDGLLWLRERNPSDSSILRIANAVAHSLRRFHDAGGLHHDLHLQNIMIDDSSTSPRCWLIDLGRARQIASPTPRQRMRDIMRLARSIEKANQPLAARSRVKARFLSSYCDGDRMLRQELQKWTDREERRINRHRLGWRLRRGILVALLSIHALACSDAPHDAATAIVSAATVDSEPRLSLLAVGDTGRNRSLPSLFEGQLAVAYAMTEEARAKPVDALILLGDNFYWHGLDLDHLVERIRQNLVRPYCYFLDFQGPRSNEVESSCPHPIDSRSPAPLYAVLGNHDLDLPGSVDLQRYAIPEFLTNWTMSHSIAEVFELPQGVSLILFESELAIHDQTLLESRLSQAIRRSRGPWRILATHRPLSTDDVGGHALGGYPAWVRTAIVNSGQPVQLALSGHHHNLQAFALEAPTPMLAIGAGSGSRAAPPLGVDQPEFLFGAIQLGFARIDLIGTGDEERLSVSLFRTPHWPVFSRFRRRFRLARFEVDRIGTVSTVETPD